MAELRSFLHAHRRIGLDTSILIYHFEANPKYGALVNPIFSWVEQAGHTAVLSTLTVTEMLVPAYSQFDLSRAKELYALLSTHPHLSWVSADLHICRLAASFRARHRMQTPDAVLAATAVRSQATAFITNDPVFKRVDAFETLVLDTLL